MSDLDVEAMLEAPYKNEMLFNPEGKESSKENDTDDKKKLEDEMSTDRQDVNESKESSKENDTDDKKKLEDEMSTDRQDVNENKEQKDREREERGDREEREERERRRHRSRSHKSRHSSRSSHRHSHHRHRSSRRRSHSYDRHSSRSRSYRSERRSRSISRRRRRSHSRSRSRSRSRSGSPRNISVERSDKPEVSEADRDRRTVFVMQLSAKLRNSELREFFSRVGKVSDVKIIADRNSRRSKGVGYVEFEDESSVEKALTLSNELLLGIPIIVQRTESEKNINSNPNIAAVNANRSKINPYSNAKDQNDSETSYKRLYVGSINFKITEEDLKILFKNFGELDFVKLHINPETGRSCGYAFIQYKRAEDARTALEVMNGYELAGRVIKVGLVSDKASNNMDLNMDDGDTVGFSMNSYKRADLMQKLSRDDEMQVPPVVQPYVKVQNPTITTNVLLTNMFNPEEETEPDWENEIEEEVGGECSKFGKILNIVVNKNSKVYILF